MIRRPVARSPLAALLAALALGSASAAAPCGALLSGYLEPHDGAVEPCLVDMQEAGLCFALPGLTLETVTRTLDAHLQAQGVPRPDWSSREGSNGSFLRAPNGERLELVLAAAGPFDTRGACRVVTRALPQADATGGHAH